ncbi:MAG: hypothetical protein MHMPM18_001659 [Marteilia pararefringens]
MTANASNNLVAPGLAPRFQWPIEADLVLLQQIKISSATSYAAAAPQQQPTTVVASRQAASSSANDNNNNSCSPCGLNVVTTATTTTVAKASGQAAAKQLEQIDWKRVAKGVNAALQSQQNASSTSQQQAHSNLNLLPIPRTSSAHFAVVDETECLARINTLLNRIQKHRTIQELVYLAESAALQKLLQSGAYPNSQADDSLRPIEKEDVPYLWYYEDAAREDFIERRVSRKSQSNGSIEFHAAQMSSVDLKLSNHYTNKWNEMNPLEKLKKISKFCTRHVIHCYTHIFYKGHFFISFHFSL